MYFLKKSQKSPEARSPNNAETILSEKKGIYIKTEKVRQKHKDYLIDNYKPHKLGTSL